MGVLVNEVLRRLCVEFGWSYAVFWKAIGCGDQIRNLVWEDGHYERISPAQAASGFEAMDMLIKESGVLRNSQNGGFTHVKCQTEDRVHTLVFKLMATHVHVLGEGMVGNAALTGNHGWLLGDVLTDNGSIPKGLTEIGNQVLAGIKTIAIIPVLPHGVVQLGSTKMILENFEFLNHVKGLFGQLQFMPGALLSIVTQKNLHQEIRLHESIGMQVATKQFGEVVTNINGLSSLSDDNGNCQRFKHLDSRIVTEPCPSSAWLYDQMSANVSETPLAKENMISTIISPSSDPMARSAINPILHLNSQLESGDREAHLMFSNQDARLLNNVLSCKSSSQGQHQPPTSLPYSRLAFLEEQLLSTSGIRQGEFDNNCESTLDNTNMRPLQSYGSTSPNPLRGSQIFSSFARSQLPDVTYDLCKVNSFPSDTENLRKQCADSSTTEIPQVLSRSDHSTFNGIFEPSQLNPIDKTSHSGSSAEKQKSNNGHFRALQAQSIQFDDHGSSYCSLLGNRPEDPVQDNRMHHDSSRIENCEGPASRDDNRGNVKAEVLQSLDVKDSLSSLRSSSENDLFDVLRLDQYKSNAHELSTDVSACITELEEGFVYNALNYELCCKGMFSEAGSDQLLDAVVSQFNPGVKHEVDDNASCKTSLKKINSSSFHSNTPINGRVVSHKQMHAKTFGLPPVHIKSEPAPSSSTKSSCSIERGEGCIPQSSEGNKSHINLWIEGQKMNRDSHSVVHGKRVDEVGKQNKKRSRPGENPRPRPKDRQMIQDRVKELREIVPNGAKCSIDALLEKTIKHMLFLQSVSKHADKLKETWESKILSKEGGLLLKDNFEGGATWAFEVGSQSMVCPIIVEDLNPPRQMLVEVLCEERGLFLEIADIVRGLGLTILKGVMEARNDKVWARFAVEANRDVTRMEIFLSLVRLLEPSAGSNKTPEDVDNVNTPHNMFLSPSIPATGSSDRAW